MQAVIRSLEGGGGLPVGCTAGGGGGQRSEGSGVAEEPERIHKYSVVISMQWP